LAAQQLQTPHKQIDADPHFKRVVSYFRPSDYVFWGGATAAFPSSLYLMGEAYRGGYVSCEQSSIADHRALFPFDV
jgi:hypothetical protein